MNEKLSRVMVLVGVMLTVVTVVALALVASGIPNDNSNQLKKEELAAMDTNNTINSSNNSSNKTKNIKNIISPAEAQEIAEQFIKEPGATAGIPKWDEVDGEMVYIVPVIINGTNVGEITINALTGENMGGAGGVSP
ncbi:MAG: hypothetical protein B655_1771 [Methanobacterium sp. Maddingley MBC34]|nr:MAG: hypothetical protein B655_1771 [Methanobacterium sp. Maddingley MBC34]